MGIMKSVKHPSSQKSADSEQQTDLCVGHAGIEQVECSIALARDEAHPVEEVDEGIMQVDEAEF